MPVTILIATPLRRFIGGSKSVTVEADDVEGALGALADQSSDLRRQLFDAEGHLRSFVNVFMGSEDVRALGSNRRDVALRDGDVLTLVLAIAGGAPVDTALSSEEILRYSRHLIMPEVTLEGQKRLKRARVLCVGAGGLGSPLALYLAAAGVGTLGIVDFDRVDLTNLQRQILYSTADVGGPKLDAAVERLRRLNPEISIVPHALRLSSENAVELIRAYDIVADGTDNFSTRYLINDACVFTGKPNVHAGVFRFEGQVSVFGADRGPCYRCLFPEPPSPELVPSYAEGGVLGVLPGILGSLQALEVLKLVLGIGASLVGRLIVFDALELKFRELPVRRSPDCLVCGEHPTIFAPVDYESFCTQGQAATLDSRGVPAISVEDFHRRRQSGEKFLLLDVREPHEHAIVQIPGAIPFPLGEIPARMHELDSAQTYTLSCHHGTRSLQAYYQLKRAGFAHLLILAGGVNAWAEKVDPSLARY